MKLLIALLLVVIIIAISSVNWRRSVKAVFFILVIEGALRKWVLPQASEVIYFLKDFVLLGAYLKYYIFSRQEQKFPIRNHFLNGLILLVILWCLLQAFNPSLGSTIIGIFGLKTYLFYIPLIWMMPALFPTEEDLYRFLRAHLLLIIPVGILGIIQFFSPPSSPINSYVQTDVVQVDVATFVGGDLASQGVRITGTFSYINNYAAYLLACFGLLIPLISIKQQKWWQVATILELLLLTINAFMTGSRSTVFSSILFLMGYLVIKGLTNPSTIFRIIKPFLIPGILIITAALFWFRRALDAFVTRTSSTNDISTRILGTLTEPLSFIQYKAIDGFGTGATHPGSVALRNALGLPYGERIPVGFEGEMGRIALELGPIGFIFWYGLRISIIIALFIVFCKLKRPLLKQLALAAFLIQGLWINGQLVFHHTFAIYYWFFTSFVFLLPQLELVTNWQQQLQWLHFNVQSTYLSDSPDGQSELP
ncbi:MAG TPA: hypothetical protein V6D28_13145 [Leptolyngbyaceae cyanobacterium]